MSRPENKGDVLLLGANDRAAQSAAKEIHQLGYAVSIADWQDIPLRYSRYIKKYHQLFDIETDASKFVSEIVSLLKLTSYRFMIPVNDAGLEVCVKYRSELSKLVNMPGIPNDEQYRFCHNKYELLLECEKLEIPTPKYVYLDSLQSLNIHLASVKYPVIAKPVHSKLIKDNKLYSFAVKRVNNELELVDFVRENIASVSIMLQEVLTGTGAGYNLLSKNGKILEAYQHERLSEPLGGGQSSYRKTIPLNQYRLEEFSKKIIQSINWSGVAMLEYKVHHGTGYMMEINGRFWGSIELGIFSGINIPADFVKVFFENLQIPQNPQYKMVTARNFKLDFRYALSKVVKHRSTKYIFSWLWSLPKSFSSNEIVEDSIFRDFKVETETWWRYFKKAFSVLITPLRNNSFKPSSKIPPVQKNSNIAFVCHGNICRSPFALMYAKKNFPGFNFDDFGFHKQENRFPSLNAVRAAADWNVDLNEHRSKTISPDTVDKMDVIFIFDRMQLKEFKNLFPANLHKVFFLGVNHEIADPYGMDMETFRKIYTQIADSLNHLFQKQPA